MGGGGATGERRVNRRARSVIGARINPLCRCINLASGNLPRHCRRFVLRNYRDAYYAQSFVTAVIIRQDNELVNNVIPSRGGGARTSDCCWSSCCCSLAGESQVDISHRVRRPRLSAASFSRRRGRRIPFKGEFPGRFQLAHNFASKFSLAIVLRATWVDYSATFC